MKLFISYSHDTEEHSAWVAKLAGHLRSHGVDVIFDQWDLRLGDDLPFFMENGLSKSNMVLIICSLNYVEKANSGISGAGYEKRILSSDMIYGGNRDLIIPVIRNNKDKEVPHFLKGIMYLDFTSDDEYFAKYRQLLERIYDEDLKAKPALGKNPFDTTSLSNSIAMTIELDKINDVNQALNGHVEFEYSSNDGKFTIGAGEYAFGTMWTTANYRSIHCYRDHVKRLGFNSKYNRFPTIPEIPEFDFSSRARAVNIGQVFVLENHYHHFAAIKVVSIRLTGNDQNNYVGFDYKIYTGKDFE